MKLIVKSAAVDAKLRFLEEANALLQQKLAEAEAARAAADRSAADALRLALESDKSATFWRDAAESSQAMEARLKATILGLGHALADLKLAEADLDADRG